MPEPMRAALLSIAAPDYYLARKDEKDRLAEAIWDERGDPRIRKFTLAVIEELARYGVPLRCFNIYRGEAAQNKAYVEGHSKARFGQSPHNYGLATDLIHATKGWDIPKLAWEAIHVIAAEVARRQNLPIRWGGHFTNLWDPAHYELKDWRKSI